MRIHIAYPIRPEPWGGANQFLKALRDTWQRQTVYATEAGEADVILYNSHHALFDVFALRQRIPAKTFIHRLDGPVGLVRGHDDTLDRCMLRFANILSDGIVFQSEWSRAENNKLIPPTQPYDTIINAPDQTLFYRSAQAGEHAPNHRVRLIATSWSDNLRKGFDYYKYLDQNLDWSHYAMTFVGRTPYTFDNISVLPPQDSPQLAQTLRAHDIYITGSKNDPCSNALIEALHCGLPAIALNSGGNPDIVGEQGILFHTETELLHAIGTIAADLPAYRQRVSPPSIETIAERYYRFIENVHSIVQAQPASARKMRFFNALRLRWQMQSLRRRLHLH